MLFKSETAPKTWDGWIYYHEGIYYLYYLISEHFACDGLAVATSQDGVQWQDRGWVLRHSDKMVRYFAFGSVWKDIRFAETMRFLCSYSEWHMEGDKNVQTLLFAWSHDLSQWNKFEEEFAFRIDERYYKRIEPVTQGPWEDPRWDGMCVVPRAEGGYYGYWTATPTDFLGFGFGVSLDGLYWEALEPPQIEWGDTPKMYFIEVGGVQKIEGKYYAMLADYASVNCGMFNFVSDTPSGPFRPSSRNFGLMRNQSKMHAYFARFLDSPDGILVNHHTLAEGQFSEAHYVVYYAPLKKARIIDGTLYFAWWHGNDKLKRREVKLNPSGEQVQFETAQGLLLEGEQTLPGKLMIRNDNETGVGILVNDQGITEIGPINSDWTGFKCEERVDREIAFGGSPRFRLLLNRTMLEFYLNDIFIQCYTMEKESNGIIVFQNVRNMKSWQWE